MFWLASFGFDFGAETFVVLLVEGRGFCEGGVRRGGSGLLFDLL